MGLRILLLVSVHFAATLNAQEIVCSDQDRLAFDRKVEEVGGITAGSTGNVMVTVGKTFLGTPYVAKTLEIGDTEKLVVNLHGLDCTTFVENVLALTKMVEQSDFRFENYLDLLETIRYKNGEMKGYPSRLHYFTEWIRNNEEKGLIEDITAELGGSEVQKEINFMSSHRDLYPFLSSEDNYEAIRATEQLLNDKPFCVLAPGRIAEVEARLQSGDIIALATSIKGLDVTHTGILSREADGRIHLLHASTASMEVEVSKLPLVDYLKGIKGNIGILVARPL